MSGLNYIEKVAIVGAGGNLGSHITTALLRTGRHTITALTRIDSKTTFPSGVITKHIDYNQPSTITEALQGQDALIITLSGYAPKGTEALLIEAAAEAGVKWILPNEWSPDTANDDVVRDVSPFAPKVETRKNIAELAMNSYIAITTGFWYEWSLAIGPAFGFDIQGRKVTLFDEGEQRISVSTWPMIGRAVASLLSLPINPTSPDPTPSLSQFRNQQIYISSLTLSQRTMFTSLLRVTGTTESDWTITKEPSKQRYETGIQEIKEGKRVGWAKMMYTRVFYEDGVGDFEGRCVNGLLGLEEMGEGELDEATGVAVERSKGPGWA